MEFFKKKPAKEDNSELPELPELPPLPMLPKFPEFKTNTNIQGIKPFPSEKPGTPNAIPPISSSQLSTQKKYFTPIENKTLPEASYEPSALKFSGQEKPIPRIKEAEPIYIRLDKFKVAILHFNEIQSKVAEIEELLKKIKEVKQKEDHELAEWAREIENIKLKMESIDRTIFSKIG
jgi:hypothetical protein